MTAGEQRPFRGLPEDGIGKTPIDWGKEDDEMAALFDRLGIAAPSNGSEPTLDEAYLPERGINE